MDSEEHRLIREMLGAYALGQLTGREETTVRWHVDSCLSCRTELATISPLAEPLKLVDLSHLSDVPSPPAHLDEAIVSRIRAERRPPAMRARRWAVGLVAAALVAIAAGGVGYWVAPRPPALPLESVAVQQSAPGISSDVDVVPHTWGMEIKLTARGFERDKTYRVLVTDKKGNQVSAGEFIGTGGEEMRCNLNSSVLRANATGFQVFGPGDEIVLTSRF